jgi:hypothetical protein
MRGSGRKRASQTLFPAGGSGGYCFFFTSGHWLSGKGRAASSGEMVAMVLW